jgi:hypothetical protein
MSEILDIGVFGSRDISATPMSPEPVGSEQGDDERELPIFLGSFTVPDGYVEELD